MDHTRKRILYVDDDPDIRMIAQMALEMVGGYEVIPCESGSEALNKALTCVPDLIVMDVMMPEMDGPTTLQRLRTVAATATIPVIFLTAKVQPAEVAHYQSLGALGVIAKPFDPMQLSTEIERIWHHA